MIQSTNADSDNVLTRGDELEQARIRLRGLETELERHTYIMNHQEYKLKELHLAEKKFVIRVHFMNGMLCYIC